MRIPASITAALVCLGLWASAAEAQIASSCLRPLAIPDKWIENQTPPWDPTDTFDPSGSNPDVYVQGFDPMLDDGMPMSLVLYNRIDPPQGRSAWAVVVGERGSEAFQNAILGCTGYLRAIGEPFQSATGALNGPLESAIRELIAQDPDAFWDSNANGGRGGVINSAFAQSPRIIALPVFAPDSYGLDTHLSAPMVKIVGFFVSDQNTLGEIAGYLTSHPVLDVPPSPDDGTSGRSCRRRSPDRDRRETSPMEHLSRWTAAERGCRCTVRLRLCSAGGHDPAGHRARPCGDHGHVRAVRFRAV
jgi:hypothetical protein